MCVMSKAPIERTVSTGLGRRHSTEGKSWNIRCEDESANMLTVGAEAASPNFGVEVVLITEHSRYTIEIDRQP